MISFNMIALFAPHSIGFISKVFILPKMNPAENLKSKEKIHKFHYLICSDQIIILFAKTYIVTIYF